jgi:hypothetical protein
MRRPAGVPASVAPSVPAPARTSIDSIVIRLAGERGAGERVARRLPAALGATLGAAQVGDARALRALVERAVREAAR